MKLNVVGLQMLTGPGRAIPPANLNATANLNGKSAQIDARLAAGSARLNVAGQAPLGAGALALRANGALDLTLLDPILTANGRRVRAPPDARRYRRRHHHRPTSRRHRPTRQR